MQMMINNTCARSGVIALVMSVTKYESEDCVGLCQDKWKWKFGTALALQQGVAFELMLALIVVTT